MKGARDGLERVVGVCELMGGSDAAEALRRGKQQPVVRPDIQPAFAVAECEGPARSADAGIDDREMHARRHVRQRVREHQRGLQHVAGPHAVREVDDLDVRRDPLHHAVAGADEVVLEPEVGEEGDEHLERTYGVEETFEVVRRCDGDHLEPVLAGLGRRLRADRDDRQPRACRGERAGGRGGCEQGDVAVGRGRPQLDRAVERQEVGAALLDEQPPRPSAATSSTRPGGSSASRPSCVCVSGTRSACSPCSCRASAVPGPTAATCRGVAASRRASSRAPFGLVTTTQSYGDGSIGSSPSGSMRSSGQRTTSCPSASSRATSGSTCSSERVTTIFTVRAPRAPGRARRGRRRSCARARSRLPRR